MLREFPSALLQGFFLRNFFACSLQILKERMLREFPLALLQGFLLRNFFANSPQEMSAPVDATRMTTRRGGPYNADSWHWVSGC